jgi:transcriptional regulator with XRE-family HTH domain
MTRTREKVKALIGLRETKPARVAAAIDMDASQFSRWLKGKGNLTVARLLALARHLGTTVEYLVDDGIDELPGEAGLPDDEEFVLRVYRNLKADPAQRLDGDEAQRRLSRPSEAQIQAQAKLVPPAVVPDVVAQEAERIARSEVPKRTRPKGAG